MNEHALYHVIAVLTGNCYWDGTYRVAKIEKFSYEKYKFSINRLSILC